MSKRDLAARGMLLGMLLGVLPACESQSLTTQGEQSRTIHQRAIKFAAKYKAVYTWSETLNRKNQRTAYALDVERVLIEGPQEHPVLVVGLIQDVFRRDGQLWVRLSNLFPESPDIDFELSCSEDTLRPAFEMREPFSTFAIVARIRKVQKFSLELLAFSVGKERMGYGVSPLLAPWSEQRFLATGDCLDMAYVGQGPIVSLPSEMANQ